MFGAMDYSPAKGGVEAAEALRFVMKLGMLIPTLMMTPLKEAEALCSSAGMANSVKELPAGTR